MTRIRKALIANRGEIACRIIRAARARDVRTVAVYSDADEGALHVREADEAVRIGRAPPSDSYLDIAKIIEAANRTGADAIHPGYGFLSERADFAEACASAGLVFIGPPAAAISAMGDKAEAKRRMLAAGVPCIPGYQGEEQSEQRLAEAAREIGFPVMLKASAGGGGRGQRIVHGADELAEAIVSARRESESAFGDSRLIVEKAIVGARHVEAQILADKHGRIVHLGERDCSLQRRRQKVIEEAPSPVVSPALRDRLGAAAIEAARAVGYVNAGTVEFLVDPATGAFYFLEMNTRLQVEHPVTEMVTGVDLVDWQFQIAEGAPLAFSQDDIRLSGWAMEARLYAEDAPSQFLPQTGRITALQFAPGVRVDAGVAAGDEVTAYYDPMIAKVIAHGASRDNARERLAAALEETALLGLTTNRSFLIALLRDETFANGAADTGYIEANLSTLAPEEGPVSAEEIAIAVAALSDAPFSAPLTGWNSRGESLFPVKLQYKDEILLAHASISHGRVRSLLGEREAAIEVIVKTDESLRFRADGVAMSACIVRSGNIVDIACRGVSRRFVDLTFAPAGEAGAGADSVSAPLAGIVTGIAVDVGARIEKGQTVATIEAMKMEHRLAAPRDGVVAEVLAEKGDQVSIRMPIIRLVSSE